MEEEKKDRGDAMIPTPPATVDSEPEIVFQAAQIAPIVDRMGRMLVDFAPHLNNLVKVHHQRLREQQADVAGSGEGLRP